MGVPGSGGMENEAGRRPTGMLGTEADTAGLAVLADPQEGRGWAIILGKQEEACLPHRCHCLPKNHGICMSRCFCPWASSGVWTLGDGAGL